MFVFVFLFLFLFMFMFMLMFMFMFIYYLHASLIPTMRRGGIIFMYRVYVLNKYGLVILMVRNNKPNRIEIVMHACISITLSITVDCKHEPELLLPAKTMN